MSAPLCVLPPGPVMMDLAGTVLSEAERARLQHPLVGGLILFGRNYASPEQLAALCAEVKAIRRIPIAIDHEGGRVQRCREGFTRLPAMRQLGQWWEEDSEDAVAAARGIGFVLAAELRLHGVDLSFTPVLDLDWGHSTVIGNRAFHRDPEVVSTLAGALIEGLRLAGMGACGKHFPGHGWVEADSHVAIPVDERDLAALAPDMLPYRRLRLDAVMPAHVTYPQIDARSAGFSPLWLTKLRQEFNFDGVIFSDDLSMEGASVVGHITARAEAAWNAGCDMLLVCNAPDKVEDVLSRWTAGTDPVRSNRVARLLPTQPAFTADQLAEHPLYRAGQDAVALLAQRAA